MNTKSLSKRRFNCSFDWDKRSGPVLYVSWKSKKIGVFLFCHRKEERSLKLFGHTSFLCARCIGTLSGLLLSFSLFILHVTMSAILASVLVIPLIVDGILQLSGLHSSNNKLRFLTGLLFSIGASTILF